MSIILKTDALTKKLVSEITVTLVENITLEINKGEFVAITGPSGSGKSSLLYLLGLLDHQTSGKIWIEDTETTNFSEEQLANIRLQKLGFVFQFHFLLPELTVLENVTLPMKRLNVLDTAAIENRGLELLENFGLKEHVHKLPNQLSGGQSQRVSISRSLANNPDIIFADEPTGNLDTASGTIVRDTLKSLAHNNGQTVIVVTHDMDFAKSADRILHIVDGRLT